MGGGPFGVGGSAKVHRQRQAIVGAASSVSSAFVFSEAATQSRGPVSLDWPPCASLAPWGQCQRGVEGKKGQVSERTCAHMGMSLTEALGRGWGCAWSAPGARGEAVRGLG